MKKDIAYHEGTYNNWKEKAVIKGIQNLTRNNSDLLIRMIFDFETGENTGRKSKKGSRSYGRLNVLRRRLTQVFKQFQDRGVNDITTITEKLLHQWADDLYKGRIKTEDGEKYEAPEEFISAFKTFWHWWMKVNRKNGIIIIDITEDLQMNKTENKFVYLTKEQIDAMIPYFIEEEQVLVKFLFDSIIRFPTEVSSLQVKNIYEKNGSVWVNIPDSIAKTFGRDFNLLYCGDALKEYIKKKELNPEDYLFPIIKDNNRVYSFNKKLKQVAVQLFGNKISHPKAMRKYSELSGYDFRHCGSIHYRMLAKKNGRISLDAIRQRGGWTDFKMLNYYTKFLGLDGEISKEETLIEEDKSQMQKQIEQLMHRIESLEKLRFEELNYINNRLQ